MNTSMPNSTTWNVKRRRDFSQLNPGTELPGYRGYIEQYKYHVGDTYGNATKILLEDKRASREAPIPGYKGFIPRQGVSELGLGARYNTICDKSLNTFYDETDRHADRIGRAYEPKTTVPDTEAKASIQLTKEDRDVLMQRRLYKQIGMVPKYTGYLPQIRFQFGHTYGDTTRSLPVCFHDQTTYGQQLATVQQSV